MQPVIFRKICIHAVDKLATGLRGRTVQHISFRRRMSSYLNHRLAFSAWVLTGVLIGCTVVQADTFGYDPAGRLQSSAQSNGLSHSYSFDAEGNVLSASHASTDTTDSSGAGNGIPDWWEYLYFGTRGIDPQASPASDGLSNLLKYAVGLSPLFSVSTPPLALTFQNFSGQDYPYLEFTRFKEAASIISLEKSTDLMSAWETSQLIYVTVSVTDLGDGRERVVLRNLTPLVDTPRVFFRLRVTAP
jgi:YD repeat-containing protein